MLTGETARTVACQRRWRLSKSKIAAFEHCPRRLWLQTHRPELAKIDEHTLALFDAGHRVGELARTRHPNGALVSEGPKEIVAALARTQALLTAAVRRPIFEAAFQRDDVIIRADILSPDDLGGWALIEVKNSASVKPYQILDAATQTWVLRGNAICVSSVTIRHVERPMRGRWRGFFQMRFVDADVTDDVMRLTVGRASVVDRARAVLSADEPQIRTGPHCRRPFRCEFRDHCSGGRELVPKLAHETSVTTKR